MTLGVFARDQRHRLNEFADRLPRASRRSARRKRAAFSFRADLQRLEPRLLLAGDLVAQWRADDLNSSVDDGEVVTNWNDSVAGITALASGEPTLVYDAVEGRSVVRFDAADGADWLRVHFSGSPVSGADDFTIATVFVTAAEHEGGNGHWFQNTGIVDASNLGFKQDWGMSINPSGQIAVGMGGGIGQPISSVYSSAAGLNDAQTHTAIFSRSGSTIQLFVDDAAPDSLTGATEAPRAGDVDLVIGANQLSRLPFTGDIAEVRVYNGSVDEAEASELRTELVQYYDNGRPVTDADEYTTEEDTFILSIPAELGVLANDLDREDDVLTATLVTDVEHGNLTLSPDGSFLYVPDKDFFGTDTFSYSALDFRPSTQLGTVSIRVTSVYDPVIPADDLYKVRPQNTLSVDANAGLLFNDANPDQAALSVVLDQDVGEGTLTLNGDGSFEYDAGGFLGATTFAYRVDDGVNLSAPATVTLNVNTPPVTDHDYYDLSEDKSFSTSIGNGILANDSDAENDALSILILDGPAHGTLGMGASGAFFFTPDPNYAGADQFTYRVVDWSDESATATVYLHIAAEDDPPIAAADVYSGPENDVIVVSTDKGVLANDTDIDTTTLSTVLVAGPSHGALDMNPDGSFAFTPNSGFIGVDTFSYSARDDHGESTPVVVQLYVGTSPLLISEILAANASSLGTRLRDDPDRSFRGSVEYRDWIELRNVADAPIDVSGYHLTDDTNVAKKWSFPEGTEIPATGTLTVFASRLNIADVNLDEQGLLHTNFTLRVNGEYLAVTAPDGRILHALDPYPQQVPDVSYGLAESGEMGYFHATSPGDANGPMYAGRVAETQLSVDHGFYADPFKVEITTATDGSKTHFTTDGSTPSPTHGDVYSGPVDISTTTTIRAISFKDGFLPSEVATSTYIFVEDVILQDNSPPGYPDTWVGNGGTGALPADYEMDPEITEHPAYRDILDDALLAIPTVSIVTDMEHLFDVRTGIYQQPERHGWERPASIELIYPDGTTGFQIDAGIRIQGGHTRRPTGSPKHSFRLRFRGVYGEEKLRYDWFGGDSVAEFDTIVLRAGGNQSWIHTNTWMGDNRSRAQYVRDQWAKDTLNAMGYAASHNDYAHLYINGIYWGLYNPTERPTADFAASYFGGQPEEFDVVNAGDVLDGNPTAWNELRSKAAFASADLSDDAQYQAVAEMLDIEAYIDYMILNHYGGNMDWDSHNWYAIRRRAPGEKFFFAPWDSEFFFISDNDNRILRSDGVPGQMFRNLRQNPEFRMQLADQIHALMFNDGLLTPDSVVERWEARSSQITDAIVAESARWGDYRRDVLPDGGPFELLERDRQWLTERERLLNDYFPNRTRTVIFQYRQYGLYPMINTPTFNQRGGVISSDFDIELDASRGMVYYTTDGSDPRLTGGGISPNAIAYDGPIRLNDPSTLRVRALDNDNWSAIDEVSFVVDVVPASAANLRISEINFNPTDPTEAEIAAGFSDSDDFEFIELVNISSERVDLSGVQFRQADVGGSVEGVAFDFSTGATTHLGPGDRILVVEDVDAFAFRYGDRPVVAGQWVGKLGNGGEQVALAAGETVIHEFAYDDAWHPSTDGGGSTLEIIDAADADLSRWGQGTSWRASDRIGGSPGFDSDTILLGDSNHDGVFDSGDFVFVLQASEYEDDVPRNSTFEEGDWNGDGDFTSDDLVLALQAGTFDQGEGASAANRWAAIAAALFEVPTLLADTLPTSPAVTVNEAEVRSQRLTIDDCHCDAVFAESHEDRFGRPLQSAAIGTVQSDRFDAQFHPERPLLP